MADLVAGYLDDEPPKPRDPATPRALSRWSIDSRDRHRLSEVLIRNRKKVVGGFMPRHAARVGG